MKFYMGPNKVYIWVDNGSEVCCIDFRGNIIRPADTVMETIRNGKFPPSDPPKFLEWLEDRGLTFDDLR